MLASHRLSYDIGDMVIQDDVREPVVDAKGQHTLFQKTIIAIIADDSLV